MSGRVSRLGTILLPIDFVSQALSGLLMGFEKTAALYAGHRNFFTEDQRIAAAENLVGDALIEKMVIPRDQFAKRPALPIEGPLSQEQYAFYDLSFYNLGVAPPRFDAGIGAPPFSTDAERELLAIDVKQNIAAATDPQSGVADPEREILRGKFAPL